MAFGGISNGFRVITSLNLGLGNSKLEAAALGGPEGGSEPRPFVVFSSEGPNSPAPFFEVLIPFMGCCKWVFYRSSASEVPESPSGAKNAPFFRNDSSSGAELGPGQCPPRPFPLGFSCKKSPIVGIHPFLKVMGILNWE